MKCLHVTYEIVTPMFLSGARQEIAEMRLPSIKGAMRFWYRVIDRRFNQPVVAQKGITYEEDLFGGTRSGAGQSRLLMRLTSDVFQTGRYEKGNRDFKGLDYLAFSLKHRKEQPPRAYLLPGQTVSFEVILRPSRDEDPERHWKAIVACLWMFGHAGAVGSRSRRGFGTVALRKWEAKGEAGKLLDELQIAYQAETIEEWVERFGQGLDVISKWFSGSCIMNSFTGFHYAQPEGFPTWKMALFEGAKCIQTFRKENKEERMAFGLPLLLPKVEYKPKEYARMASPVMLRVVRLYDRYFPLFFLQSGPFPSMVKLEKRKGEEQDYSISFSRVMSRFGDFLQEEGYKEAKWGD